MRSRRNTQLNKATTLGIAAMMTPADTAVVMLTPHNMHTVNKKFPRNDSRNTNRLVLVLRGGSSLGRRSQCGMARAPMPKRNQASNATGNTATMGFDKAT